MLLTYIFGWVCLLHFLIKGLKKYRHMLWVGSFLCLGFLLFSRLGRIIYVCTYLGTCLWTCQHCSPSHMQCFIQTFWQGGGKMVHAINKGGQCVMRVCEAWPI